MKNIIFDIGNVLLEFQPENFLYKYYDKDTSSDLMMIIFSSEEWIKLDLGDYMIEDVIRILTNRNPEYKKEITDVLHQWTEMMVPIQKNVDIAYQLKEEGYSLYLLSNFHLEAFDTVYKKYDFFSIFDGKVISAHEHVIKPNEEIYKILLDRYQLDPKQSVFIDDMLANIHAAERLHIKGIHLNYNKDLKIELEKILG